MSDVKLTAGYRALIRAQPVLVMMLVVSLGTGGVAYGVEKNGFDLQASLVPANEILRGGPPRDGIPALDRPRFVKAEDASFLEPEDRVLGIRVKGVARAYPIKILNYHEIVNDRPGGEAVVVTYCPLCGSGMAFAAEVDGSILTFGVSGLLYNSDVLLFDRQTESLWSQLSRQAVTGALKGEILQSLPVTHTTWRDWRERHPDTDVLSTRTGHIRNYDVDPYPNYGSDGRIYFPVAKEDSRYPRKAIVMGLEIDGHFKAYPFVELAAGPARFRDEFQGRAVEIVFDEENQTASATNDDGNELPTVLAFWFAWYAFHPDTAVYQAGATYDN